MLMDFVSLVYHIKFIILIIANVKWSSYNIIDPNHINNKSEIIFLINPNINVFNLDNQLLKQ